MKALTLWQPWASLVAMGEKKIETRTWSTQYRGELAIHAAAFKPKWAGPSSDTDPFRDELADILGCRRDRDDRTGLRLDDAINRLPHGKVLCIVRLISIEQTVAIEPWLSQQELVFGNYEEGRFAWHLELVKVFDEPIPAKGNRMLWNWEQPS